MTEHNIISNILDEYIYIVGSEKFNWKNEN